jgi:anthranilate phosphoribosyltransferase
MIRSVLAGERGAPRDIVVLNAGAALFIAGKAASVVDGMAQAAAAIDRGDAARALDRMAAASMAGEPAAGASA